MMIDMMGFEETVNSIRVNPNGCFVYCHLQDLAELRWDSDHSPTLFNLLLYWEKKRIKHGVLYDKKPALCFLIFFLIRQNLNSIF